MLKTCNNCDVRKCTHVSRNDWPNMRPRPYRKADKSLCCDKHVSIIRTVPFNGRIIKNGKVLNG